MAFDRFSAQPENIFDTVSGVSTSFTTARPASQMDFGFVMVLNEPTFGIWDFSFAEHTPDGCACGHDHGGYEIADYAYLAKIGELDVATLTDLGLLDGGLSTPNLVGQEGGPIANDGDDGDILGTVETTATISVGESITSDIGFAGDQDWFAIELVAGQTYEFTMTRTFNGQNLDPYLELMDANGVQVDFDDDSGGDLNSRMVFEATTSGTFYVNAHDFASEENDTGEYIVAVNSFVAPTEVRTVDEIANFLTSEYWSPRRWTQTEITFNIEGLTADAQVLAIAALEAWEDITPLTFTRTTSPSANLTFDDEEEGAFARSDTSFIQGERFITSSEINISKDWNGGDFGLDTYSYQTFLHEIGHSLGLGHGGPYNSTADYGIDNTYVNDSWAFTVMSYFDQAETGLGSYRFVLGPQQADIAAIQSLYGENPDGTRTGDTVYGFNSTEDDINDWSQFTLTLPEGTYIRPPSYTIYDTGGTDTIDLSGYSADQTLSLVEGTFSTLGFRPSAQRDVYENVVSIAVGTVIENAIGGSGNDTIIGNGANNVFDGGEGDDTFTGGGGGDTYMAKAGAGNDTVTDFSAAADKIIFEGLTQAQQDAAIASARDVGGNTVIDLPDGGSITLVGVAASSLSPQNFDREAVGDLVGTGDAENLSGDDGSNRIDGAGGGDTLNGEGGNDTLIGGDGQSLSAVEAQVYRLYQATLDRAPDAAGLAGWTTQIEGGRDFLEIVAGFVNSSEFQTTYGDLDDEGFVNLLYNNVLNRNADPAGLQGWLNQLAAGNSRESVVRGFSDSQEFIGRTDLATQAWATDVQLGDVEGQVFRLYQATLGRQPDPGGFQGFIGQIEGGRAYTDIISDFTNSGEFQGRYGSLDDEGFINLLYNNVLNRNADSAGLQGWLNQLAAGNSRESVVRGFAESGEFIGRTADPLEAFMRANNNNWQDTLDGGVGNDQMFGGRGADTFVFDASEAGSDTVYGLETWDSIDLNGFGYNTAADFTAQLTQDGDDVVFTDGSVTVRFVATDIDTVTGAYNASTGAETPNDKIPVAEAPGMIGEGDTFDFSGLQNLAGTTPDLGALQVEYGFKSEAPVSEVQLTDADTAQDSFTLDASDLDILYHEDGWQLLS